MRIAVFGAGYAGLPLARRLERSLPPSVDLVVVNDSDHHLVKHEIHRAIRRPAVGQDLRIPLGDVLDRATIHQATVTDVDAAAGEATLADGDTLDYDVGAVCLGAETAYYELPGVAEHALPLTRLPHAAEIRAEFLDTVVDDHGRVVIGGAGLSGIQVAGELAELAGERGVEESVEIQLLEQRATVAPGFPKAFQRAIEDELGSRDVVVRTDATVASATADSVRLADGTAIDTDLFVWTGGIGGSEALAGERPLVRDRLRFEGDTFVLGDAGRVIDADGTAVPASAQAAVRQARVAAENVTRLVEYRQGDRDTFEPRLASFRFDSPGWLVSVGDDAVAQLGSAVITGSAAVVLKTSVGASYLSSVGAIHNAVELVREELGLAGDDLAARPSEKFPADGDADGPIEVDVSDGENGS